MRVSQNAPIGAPHPDSPNGHFLDALAGDLWRQSAPTEAAYFTALCWSHHAATAATLDTLQARDFRHPTGARIFAAVLKLREQGEHLNADTVKAECLHQAEAAEFDSERAAWENAADAAEVLRDGPRHADPHALATELAAKIAPRRRIEIVTADEVKRQAPPRWIVDGVLIENSVAELVGAAATFKSFQALALAEAVASGHEWHGHATQQAPVVYVTGEGRGGLKQRIQALEIRHQRPCRVRFILQAVQLHQPEEVAVLLDAIAALPEPPGLIVVDTLARCFVGGDENSAKDAGLFVAGIDRIRAATGATVLPLHHLNKIGTARGSTAFDGAFDTIIEARRENTTVTLRCLKQKDAAEFEPITLARRVVELDEHDEHGRLLTSLVFDVTDAPPISAPNQTEATRDALLKLLHEQFPQGADGNAWLEAAEKKNITKRSGFFNHRKALMDAGRIRTDDAGNWHPVQ